MCRGVLGVLWGGFEGFGLLRGCQFVEMRVFSTALQKVSGGDAAATTMVGSSRLWELQ